MGLPSTTSTPGQQSIVVKIEDVDIPNRLVHVFDKTNARIQISFRDIPGGGLLRIPAQGERWIAQRQGWIWRLVSRQSTTDEQVFIADTLAPGDTYFSTPGTLYVAASALVINGHGVGVTVYDEFYHGSSFTSVTLSADPVNATTIQPFFNGALVAPSSWSLSDRTLTFTTALSSGTLIVYYQVLQTAYTDAATISGRGGVSGTEA